MSRDHFDRIEPSHPDEHLEHSHDYCCVACFADTAYGDHVDVFVEGVGFVVCPNDSMSLELVEHLASVIMLDDNGDPCETREHCPKCGCECEIDAHKYGCPTEDSEHDLPSGRSRSRSGPVGQDRAASPLRVGPLPVVVETGVQCQVLIGVTL